ncbi:MAG: hypothetical protein WCP28_13460 [Actinomycetes bacterium]
MRIVQVAGRRMEDRWLRSGSLRRPCQFIQTGHGEVVAQRIAAHEGEFGLWAVGGDALEGERMVEHAEPVLDALAYAPKPVADG